VAFKIRGEGPKDLGDSVSRARPGTAAAGRGGWPGQGAGAAAVPGSGLTEAQRGFWGCSGDRL